MTDGAGGVESISTIQPVAELFTGSCTALWATTYNLDLHLFSEFLLPRLGEPPLNVVILADHDRLTSSLDRIPPERVDTLASVNRRWLLRGVRTGGAAFHPKTYLSLQGSRATLLVGSGNLSSHGIDLGREVFTAFHSGTPVGDAAIATWRAWTRRLVALVADTTLAGRFQLLEEKLPPAASPAPATASPLMHNLDTPLADQLLERLKPHVGDGVDQLLVTAPFFDSDVAALSRLIGDYKPNHIQVFMTAATKVDGERLRRVLDSSGASVEVSFYEPEQFVHAKLVGLVTGARSWLLSGSANLSRAGMTHAADQYGNIEMAVLAQVDPETTRRAFLPPDTTTVTRSLGDLASLSFEPEEAPASAPVVLVRAVALDDGRVEVVSEPALGDGWQLSDLSSDHPLVAGNVPGTAQTRTPVSGRLVQIVSGSGSAISNRVVVDDPGALARALRSSHASGHTERPAELTAGDLDSPLGAAITWLHRNLVMDVTERVSSTPTGGVSSAEADEQGDDTLWERLEREQLARDPRTGMYPRILRPHSTDGSDPIVELLEAFGTRAPATDTGGTILSRIIHINRPESSTEGEADAEDRQPHRWKASSRIRVRARNALRRWAAAQADPRLVWVNPLAPAGNFAMIAATFAQLRVQAVNSPGLVELTEEDLDDLWVRWLRPFVGTGAGDGWLDQLDGNAKAQVLESLPSDLPQVLAALVWLAIRPGSNHRRRVIGLQPSIMAARKHGLLDPSDETARYLSAVTSAPLSRERVASDLLAAQDFIDDELWCERLAGELDLPFVRIRPSPGAARIQARLDVGGIDDPLVDPRVPRLVAEVRHYRECDGVAVYAGDGSWRLALPRDEPVVFIAEVGQDERVTERAVTTSQLEELVASSGVLADLFPREDAA